MTNGKAIIILNSLKQYYNDKNEDSYVGFDDEDNEAIDMAIKALEQTSWIPISERLPEEMGTYMTTIDYGKHGLATGQRYYYGQGLWEDDCVIAWMPLPETYKAESEVQDDE